MPFFHPNWYVTLFWLLVLHAFFDYAGQGDFLAQAKNSNTPVGKDIWPVALVSHALMHAGAVMLVTGSILLAMFELIAHALIDRAKTQGMLSFNQDQGLHVVCKVFWVVFMFYGI